MSQVLYTGLPSIRLWRSFSCISLFNSKPLPPYRVDKGGEGGEFPILWSLQGCFEDDVEILVKWFS
ncbi:hypothetical protein DPMN_065890 [Dreissena polymorpha]|uniref:Uncharacterized protein n=1 Tax=Dreissena polymorpha TaxID=45954 RepID=A0A9D4BUJ8_DREPO|nr:hypothetical protein DPMN_065890 [Dreissena polymorpha]